MRITEVARLAGVSPKAVRYYERIGLITPGRAPNGYREYSAADARAVQEIRELSDSGITPGKARPFIDCLELGHEHSDDCVSSLAAYQETIDELDRIITSLTQRRETLQARLESSAARGFPKEPEMTDYTRLPEGLPAPEDDGGADHLAGMPLPSLTLTTSGGDPLPLLHLGTGTTIIYLYPLTGRPGVDLPEGWDSIPGARGCSTEACDFRDHFDDLRDAGADRVYGFSSQSPEYQAEVVDRLHLPFPMISDPQMELGDALQLPTFAAPGHERLYSRLTLVVTDNVIEHAFYPIFPPNEHAQQVLGWLRSRAR
ncbi:MAG: MerR family transcriptional regulator [Actinomycetota bacterium]